MARGTTGSHALDTTGAATLAAPRLAISSHRRRLLASAAIPVAAGIIAAAWLPRGPVTSADAIVLMVVTLGVGVIVGWSMGSRWSIILGPLLFLAAFELGRMGTVGPTVEGIHLGSTYGIIAFVVGRGTTYLLALAPMAVGASVGLGFAGRLGRVGWLLTGAAGVLVLGLAVVIAQPPSTAPIVGPDGESLPGSIAELTTVPIGGHDQALMIRGRSVENPVFLHLAGGPGGTDIGAMRADTALESDFVVVTWDQRGTGKSYGALDPTGTLTLDQTVSDTIELAEYLRERFDEERIYLHGQSWGSTLGVLAVQERPDLFHAFVGSGQMVSQRGTDIMFYEDTLAWAEASGLEAMVETLIANGAPPYEDVLRYELALSHEHDWNPYPEWDGEKEMPFNLFVPENDLMDQVNGLRAFLDMFSVVYPQLQEIDFRVDVPRLEVPVTMVVGAHEARGRAVLADEWFAMLDAPAKERIVFEHSGHRPSFEEPGRFAEVMRDVLEATYPSR